MTEKGKYSMGQGTEGLNFTKAEKKARNQEKTKSYDQQSWEKCRREGRLRTSGGVL